MSVIDPRIRELAELFVDQLLVNFGPNKHWSQRDGMVARTAAAMERAVEDECAAIRRDLVDPGTVWCPKECKSCRFGACLVDNICIKQFEEDGL